MRKIRGLIGFHGAARQLGEDRGVACGVRQLAHREAAKPEEILRLELAGLANADNDKPRNLEPFRDNQLERCVFLAGEALSLGGARDQIGRRAQGLAGGGTEFEAIVAEHDQNAR